MEWRIKQWVPLTGNYYRTLGYLKSVHYKAQCNDTSDFRFGSFLNEVLTVEIYYSDEQKITAGSWVTLEANNNPAATDASRTAGYQDSNWTYYGLYKVSSVEDGKNSYTFTAYSVTHDLNTDYSARLKYLGDSGMFPMQAYDLVSDVCTYANLSFSFPGGYNALQAITINKFYASGITVGDILSAAAELAGCIVIDAAGRYNEPPTAPISMQRGVRFQVPVLRTNFFEDPDGPWINKYYLIAPTDAAVDHDVFDDSYEWFANVYYKEDGLEAGGSINPITSVEAVKSDGTTTTLAPTTPTTPTNPYRITGNILVDNCDGGPALYNVWNRIQSVLGDPILRPSTVRLFPFNCPFRCGDIANVTNGDGISFQMPIMSLEINDYEAVLECTGNSLYETAQNQYTTPEDVGTVNATNIESLRDSKADLSLLAEGHVSFVYRGLDTNGSASFDVENATKFVLISTGAQANSKGMWICNVTSTGGFTYKEVAAASNETISWSNNVLTLTAANPTFFVFFVFNGSVTKTGGS